jgi:15-cis-phytoene synthase
MGLQVPGWEQTLLGLAREALEGYEYIGQVVADRQKLDHAYQLCAQITRQHSRTFFLASGLLPLEKRCAVRALYAFCRVTDDMVDNNTGDRQSALDQWRDAVVHPSPINPVALAWADAQARFNVPTGYAVQLINGVRRDLRQTRYESFDELAEYAYGVASTVGLMAMHIIGFAGDAALPYAVKLGVALQITNILRDVGEDWRLGRLYLPCQDLAAFGLSEADIAAGCNDARWKGLMRFQIERARALYIQSEAGIPLLQRDGRFAILAASQMYQGILRQIERNDYDVFSRRASVSLTGKLLALPNIWWQAQHMQPYLELAPA